MLLVLASKVRLCSAAIYGRFAARSCHLRLTLSLSKSSPFLKPLFRSVLLGFKLRISKLTRIWTKFEQIESSLKIILWRNSITFSKNVRYDQSMAGMATVALASTLSVYSLSSSLSSSLFSSIFTGQRSKHKVKNFLLKSKIAGRCSSFFLNKKKGRRLVSIEEIEKQFLIKF